MPTPQENDAVNEEARLLERTGAGDREAFRLLYARYSAPLFSLAVRMVGDVGEAEELLQDGFMKFWRSAGSYDPGKSRPFTWAVTVMRRTCIDHLRRRQRFPAMAPLSEDDTAIDDSAGDSVRQTAQASEESAIVRDAIAESPPNQRRALELALFSGMTHAEIAESLGQPVGTVKSWIRRGLLGLRATLNEPTR